MAYEDLKDIDDEEKLEFYLQEKIKIHITLMDGTFLNGFIDKKVKKGIYWFKDDILSEGVFLSLKNIYKIREFKEVGE